MIGLCCHYLDEVVAPRSGKTSLVNIMHEKSLQLGRYRSGEYSKEFIKAIYVSNIKNLSDGIRRVSAAGFRHFRMSSSLLPLADVVDRSLWDNDVVSKHLRSVGDFVKSVGMRLTTHPGQFVVLSSDRPDVVQNSVNELATHAWIFDAMGLDRTPQYAINVHGGKSDRLSSLINVVDSLPDAVKSRLTIENDESCYSVSDLLDVFKATGVPVVFDSHHASFNDGGLLIDDAFELSALTWPNGIKPLQHLSNTAPEHKCGSFSDQRKHSDFVHYIPGCQLRGIIDDSIDVEFEFKAKNFAIVRAVKEFGVRL